VGLESSAYFIVSEFKVVSDFMVEINSLEWYSWNSAVVWESIALDSHDNEVCSSLEALNAELSVVLVQIAAYSLPLKEIESSGNAAWASSPE